MLCSPLSFHTACLSCVIFRTNFFHKKKGDVPGNLCTLEMELILNKLSNGKNQNNLYYLKEVLR